MLQVKIPLLHRGILKYHVHHAIRMLHSITISSACWTYLISECRDVLLVLPIPGSPRLLLVRLKHLPLLPEVSSTPMTITYMSIHWIRVQVLAMCICSSIPCTCTQIAQHTLIIIYDCRLEKVCMYNKRRTNTAAPPKKSQYITTCTTLQWWRTWVFLSPLSCIP